MKSRPPRHVLIEVKQYEHDAIFDVLDYGDDGATKEIVACEPCRDKRKMGDHAYEDESSL